jgi:hypothetical protein
MTITHQQTNKSTNQQTKQELDQTRFTFDSKRRIAENIDISTSFN